MADDPIPTARASGLDRLLWWGCVGLVVLGLLQLAVTGNATPRWAGGLTAAVAAGYLVVVTLRSRR